MRRKVGAHQKNFPNFQIASGVTVYSLFVVHIDLKALSRSTKTVTLTTNYSSRVAVCFLYELRDKTETQTEVKSCCRLLNDYELECVHRRKRHY